MRIRGTRLWNHAASAARWLLDLRSPSPATAEPPTGPVVLASLCCSWCNYDLRGVPLDALCPECAGSVLTSMAGRPALPMRHIDRILRGGFLLILGNLFWLLALVALAIGSLAAVRSRGVLHPHEEDAILLLITASLPGPILCALGWIVAALPPRYEHIPQPRSLAVFTCWLCGLAALAGTGQVIVLYLLKTEMPRGYGPLIIGAIGTLSLVLHLVAGHFIRRLMPWSGRFSRRIAWLGLTCCTLPSALTSPAPILLAAAIPGVVNLGPRQPMLVNHATLALGAAAFAITLTITIRTAIDLASTALTSAPRPHPTRAR